MSHPIYNSRCPLGGSRASHQPLGRERFSVRLRLSPVATWNCLKTETNINEAHTTCQYSFDIFFQRPSTLSGGDRTRVYGDVGIHRRLGGEGCRCRDTGVHQTFSWQLHSSAPFFHRIFFAFFHGGLGQTIHIKAVGGLAPQCDTDKSMAQIFDGVNAP